MIRHDGHTYMNDICIVEEYLLLTLEDTGGEFDSIPEIYADCGLVGAVLLDLTFKNRVDSDPRCLWVIDPTPTQISMLDRILSKITQSDKRLTPEEWIVRLYPDAPSIRSSALTSLCERNILCQKDHQYMWFLKERRYPTTQDQERIEVKNRLLALLYNDDIPSPHDAALVGLANASFLFEKLLTTRELSRVKRKRYKHTLRDPGPSVFF
jgi:golgi phosphoprotein 3